MEGETRSISTRRNLRYFRVSNVTIYKYIKSYDIHICRKLRYSEIFRCIERCHIPMCRKLRCFHISKVTMLYHIKIYRKFRCSDISKVAIFQVIYDVSKVAIFRYIESYATISNTSFYWQRSCRGITKRW